MFKGTQAEDLSGMHYPWLKDEEVMIGDCKGRIMYNEDEVGVAIWYDEENELAYNIDDRTCNTGKIEGACLFNVEQALIGLPNPIFDATAEEAVKVSGTPRRQAARRGKGYKLFLHKRAGRTCCISSEIHFRRYRVYHTRVGVSRQKICPVCTTLGQMKKKS